MKNISILGTGWLGLPFAKVLLEKGFSVKGSTTSEEKLKKLEEHGIEPYLIQVSPDSIKGNISGFLEGSEMLLIDFPPGLRKDPTLNYAAGIQLLASEIQKSGIKKVIFVSSISVYEETESFKIYTEDSQPNATSRNGAELAKAEQLLLENTFFKTTILRFGGLIGAGRHPVKYLAGRSDLSNPLAPVNLIHQEDCIGIILRIFEKDIFGDVFNAVYPVNPPKEAYYQKKAVELGLEPPRFDHEKPSVGKIISASKVMRELEYEFRNKI